MLFAMMMLSAATTPAAEPPPNAGRYFTIKVVDPQAGRGVPLVELETVNRVRYVTDSNGIVAFYEPGLMDQSVFFHVRSHGYEFPKDGFGIAGRALQITEGGEATLEVKRTNVAERLYRITGAGVYRDSVLVGAAVPTERPVLNGNVFGQDSVQNAVYQGKLYWFWGDTGWPKYPLGNFHMTGATSALPGTAGALDPDAGVNLTYFVREDGNSKEMAPRPEPGPVWLDAFVTLPDTGGRERMFAGYARVTPTMETVERGLMEYNDDKQIFEKIEEFDLKAPVHPNGHPFKLRDGDSEYIWFPAPFPLVRVRADAKALRDLKEYQAWTPLKPGSRLDAPEIDRDASGAIRYAWRSNTPALDPKQQDELVKAGKLKPHEAWIQLRDVNTGKPVTAHSGSVYWNEHRQRWITIRCEVYGTSMLGETWYAEADTPIGPWVYAVKIVTHDQYSFYNPKQHPEFDKDGGRVIYFEGTYTHTFSGNPLPTPRYDYNQIMYRLDLNDMRVRLPVPIYDTSADGAPNRFEVAQQVKPKVGPIDPRIAFFAPDRPALQCHPVFLRDAASGALALETAARLASVPDAPVGSGQPGAPVFYALPPDVKDPPATTTTLYEFVHETTKAHAYSTDAGWSKPGFRRSDKPLCRVWKNPYASP